MTLLVTGGAGFIASNFIQHWCQTQTEPVVTVDALTYAGHRANLMHLPVTARHRFIQADLREREAVERLLDHVKPRAILHAAAETHVDRSLYYPVETVHNNVMGTAHLLQASLDYWKGLPAEQAAAFKFVQVSTDEVYGSLPAEAPPTPVGAAFHPNNPYSASKAAADHLARAWHQSFGLPVMVTFCGNNYGPHQYPEKLIPFMIRQALAGKPLPLYGTGLQQRDWIHVLDHCRALASVLEHGVAGQHYHFGSGSNISNLALLEQVCDQLDQLRPLPGGASYRSQICFIADRPAHDQRYALDSGVSERLLNWRCEIPLERGIALTVQWYLENPDWFDAVSDDALSAWYRLHYPDNVLP
ncbi:MAG: dTDP-glucose 4,6-dehydratase [Pigmentiphaga sp.]